MSLFLSPTEEKIAKALKEAAAIHVSDGKDPNGAVKTAAVNNGLNADMTDRLVEAFNITFIRSHLKTAQDKDSATPLADKAKVFEAVFKDHPLPGSKTASLNKQGADEELPNWSFEDSRKTAEPERQEDPGYFAGPQTIPGRIASLSSNDEKKMSDIRIVKTAALESAISAGTKLAEKFSSSYFREDFKRFQSEALSKYGTPAIEVLESVRKAAGIQEGGALRDPASHAGKHWDTYQFKDDVGLVGEVVESTRKYAEAAQEERDFSEEMDRRKSVLQKVFPARKEGERSDSSKSGPLSGPNLANILSSERRPTSFGGITEDVLTSMDLISSPSARTINESHIQDLIKDYGEASKRRFREDRGLDTLGGGDADEIRAFTHSSVISDLIANDDIIAAADPNDVKDAFSTLVRISPEAASNPSIARSVIRSTLSGDGALDVFTADQVAEFQQNVMKNRLQVGAGSPKEDR